MSTVCVLTPIVIGSWPMIAGAIAGAASSLGFTLATADVPLTLRPTDSSVETEVPNSEVMADVLARGEKIRVTRDGVAVDFGVDDRGKVTVCASGRGKTNGELKKIGQEIAGRVVQQFAYHKLVNELKSRGYQISQERVERDQSIQITIRSGH